MGVIEEFVRRYRHEYDYYDQAARLVSQQLDVRLQAAGIRAIVTYRAKMVDHLDAKVRQRESQKSYKSIDDIYEDIHDLAGVRVALYFPAQRNLVGLIIKELFHIIEEIDYPKENKQNISYAKRFSGYAAIHHCIRLKETNLGESQKSYADARVEIQVASVLMHAWAEVEHDLAYKQYQGTLSEDEYAILDELNGMVIAGEIVLERLQRAGEIRIASQSRKFSNHYDLAAHLLRRLHDLADAYTLEKGLGRVDFLYELLDKLELKTPNDIERYLCIMHSDLESRPIAEQIVDPIISEDPSRYDIYNSIRNAHEAIDGVPGKIEKDLQNHTAMGEFLQEWIKLERFIRQNAPINVSQSDRLVTIAKFFDSFPDLNPQIRSQYNRLRHLRNQLVHGIEIPEPIDLVDAAQQLREMYVILNGNLLRAE